MASRLVVLDASALIAVFRSERGHERVAESLEGASMSAVNWSEVMQHISPAGRSIAERLAQVEALGVEIVDFTADHAALAAAMFERTVALGLSFADRACLALALELEAIALTGDRVWSDADVGVEVVQFR